MITPLVDALRANDSALVWIWIIIILVWLL